MNIVSFPQKYAAGSCPGFCPFFQRRTVIRTTIIRQTMANVKCESKFQNPGDHSPGVRRCYLRGCSYPCTNKLCTRAASEGKSLCHETLCVSLSCKWRGQDSNLRPQGYEPCELPDCSTPQSVTLSMHEASKNFKKLRLGCSVSRLTRYRNPRLSVPVSRASHPVKSD